jgi:hypothetical protein
MTSPQLLRGVLESESDENSARLLVAAAESDHVLVALVQQGWHVESVKSGPPDHVIRIEARRRTAR